MQEIKASVKEVIFISGRFRSGTSMLWNVFRQLSQYCVWYEPLHPNLLSHIKHVKPKEDHLGIDDYWYNYSKLRELEQYYSYKFGQESIYLEKHDKSKQLNNYINYIIENSNDKIPVLQFNRIDLRLSWIKNNFPKATIIHIERDPFALWESSRKHINITRNKKHESYPDAYDLMQWSVDLAKHFPMLQASEGRNGYYRHYFIWKLSQKIAQKNANILLNLDNDFLNTQNGITKLSSFFNWDEASKRKVLDVIKKPSSMHHTLKKEKTYTDIEAQINKEFIDLGLIKLFPSCNLSSIKHEYKDSWSNYEYNSEDCIHELMNALKFQKDELTELINSGK